MTGTWHCTACGATSNPIPAGHVQAALDTHMQIVHGFLWAQTGKPGGTR